MQNKEPRDLIDRQAALNEIAEWMLEYGALNEKRERDALQHVARGIKKLPFAQPEQKTCEGCKHRGKWENELEYGASCPCLVCKRRASDNYERSD